MKTTTTFTALTIVAVTALAAASAAPPTAKKKPAPAKLAASKAAATAAAIAHGHALFVSNCAVCHGANADGDDGPSLHKKQLADTFVTGAIKDGIKNEMPSFKSKLKDPDVALIVTYVHSLQK